MNRASKKLPKAGDNASRLVAEEDEQAGNRLRLWRESSKMTREALADAIGVSVRSLQEYEKGLSTPKGAPLRRLAELGCDPTWVITGREPAILVQDPSQIIAPRTSDVLEFELDEIERKLEKLDSVPLNIGNLTAEQADICERLQRIATSSADNSIRARADLYLKLAFADQAAEARREERAQPILARIRRAGEVVMRAETSLGWSMPMELKEAMKGLVVAYDISEQDLTEALDMMRSALMQKR
jgi:transcriptional regulator with XRE-family HTH domain